VRGARTKKGSSIIQKRGGGKVRIGERKGARPPERRTVAFRGLKVFDSASIEKPAVDGFSGRGTIGRKKKHLEKMIGSWAMGEKRISEERDKPKNGGEEKDRGERNKIFSTIYKERGREGREQPLKNNQRGKHLRLFKIGLIKTKRGTLAEMRRLRAPQALDQGSGELTWTKLIVDLRPFMS